MKKRIIFCIMTLAAVVLLSACKKNSEVAEAGLVAQTTPANNSNNLNILGPDFPLKVEITSVMPAQGVKIEITAKKESFADPAFFSSTNNTSAPQNNYTITNTPSGVSCMVNITVTSLTKANNVWMGSYRYSKK